MKTAKQDHKIMSILKVNEISRVICDTNMGTLKLRIRKGETEYKFILDAVELPKDMNKELMEAIYPIVTKIPISGIDSFTSVSMPKVIKVEKSADKLMHELSKPKGRPKGSLNKKKTEENH